jgi:hypothetical protein
MALAFHRRLATPLWASAFFTAALTAPPPTTPFLMPMTTLFVIAAVWTWTLRTWGDHGGSRDLRARDRGVVAGLERRRRRAGSRSHGR